MTKANDRRQTHENTHEYIDIDTFKGPVEDLINRIRGWQALYGTELYITVSQYYSSYDGCEFDANLMCIREETEVEYQKRMETTAKKKVAAAKRKVTAAKTAATKKIKREADDRKKLRELAKKYPEELNA